MRDIIEVIAKIKLVIPAKETKLLSSIDTVVQDTLYSAPELAFDRWYELSCCIRAHFGNRTPEEFNEWEMAMVKLFNPEYTWDEDNKENE